MNSEIFLHRTHRVAAWLLGGRKLRERNAVGGSASILTYHGVLREELAVPDWCFITERDFERQISFLVRNYQIVHLDEIARLDSGARRRGKPLVAITFDDGFASNYELALPILSKYGAPATIFLATAFLDSEDTVWFARLHDAICHTSRPYIVHEGLRIKLATVADRALASATLQAFVKGLLPEASLNSCREAVEKLGSSWDSAIPEESPMRMLSRQQVRAMADTGLIRFGAHSATHVILSLLDDETLQAEIAQSIQDVAGSTGSACTMFAYPNGRLGDFDDRARNVLESHGVRIAVTSVEGRVVPGDDPLAYRRLGIGAGESSARLSSRLCGLNHIFGTDFP